MWVGTNIGRGLIGVLVAALISALGFVAPPGVAADPAPAHGVPAPRIVGGKRAAASTGFVIALLRRDRFTCSGSVIAPTKVLTAAHCLAGSPAPGELTVLAGKADLKSPAGEAIAVTEIAVDPDFGIAPLHDFAVLTLSQPTSAPAIALPTVEEDAAATARGHRLTISGFGRRNPIDGGRPLIGKLRSTTETVRSNCRRVYGIAYIPASQICTEGSRIRASGRLNLHRGGCSGDSGGPLVADTPAGPRLVGVVSVGLRAGPFACALAAPELFARVAADRAFIDAEAFGPAAPAPLVSFTGGGLLAAQRQVGFPVKCSVDCTLTVTMTLGIGHLRVKPQTISGNFKAGETAVAFLALNRSAARLVRVLRRRAVLQAEVTAAASDGATETRSRLFGFHR